MTVNRSRVFAWHPRREQWFRVVFGAAGPDHVIETTAKEIEEGDSTVLLPWDIGLKDVHAAEARV